MATQDYASIDDMIQAALRGLQNHWLVKNPVVVGADGVHPIGITRFRNFSGADLGNSTGLTCSVYPYAFTANPTVDSSNASVVLDPYAMGTNVRLARAQDQAYLNIAVELTLQDYGTVTVTDPTTGFEIQTNHPERILHRWADIVGLILKTDLNKLGGLVASSSVKSMNFSSANYEGEKGRNFVLHRALLLWQTCYYPVCEWLLGPPTRTKDLFIGVDLDGEPVWWRVDEQVLAAGYGKQMLRTPTGLRMAWDPKTKQFVNPDNGAVIDPTSNEFRDPSSGLPIIDTDVTIVGYLIQDDEYLYYKKSANQLLKGLSEEVTKLPDGRPLGYDPVYMTFVNPDTGADYALKDFVDPSTRKLWMTPDWTVGVTLDKVGTTFDQIVL